MLVSQLLSLPADVVVEELLLETQMLTLVLTSTQPDRSALAARSHPLAFIAAIHASWLTCHVKGVWCGFRSKSAGSSVCRLPVGVPPLPNSSPAWLLPMPDAPAVRRKPCVRGPLPWVEEPAFLWRRSSACRPAGTPCCGGLAGCLRLPPTRHARSVLMTLPGRKAITTERSWSI
jgi:hypothetical protein